MNEEQEGKEKNGKGDAGLSEEEKRYYTSMLEEADEIVFQYEGNMGYEDDGEPSSYIVGEVFNKIATPLFYLRDVVESMLVAPKKTEEECVKNEFAEVMMKVEEEKRAEECNGEHCSSEEGENGSGREVINEYEEAPTLNDLIGKAIKVLDVQDMMSQFDNGRSIEVEGMGWVATHSKVLGGQIQHLKDTGKLPAVGTIEKKKSGKGGRSYYSFSSPSSFMQANDEKTEGLSEAVTKINKELGEKREIEKQEKEINEFMEY